MNKVRIDAMAVFFFLAACGTSDEPAIRYRPADVTETVDAIELASAFESSESQAVEQYVGKRRRIKGLFKRMDPLADGRIAMVFKTSKETFRPVHCVLDDAGASELNRFSTGDAVTVNGEIRGFAESRYFVTVERCVVE